MAKFDKEIFDKVKKGDSIKVTFDSNQIVGGGFNKGVEKELLVKSKNLVGKGKSYESEKITFSNVANPNGVKYYAYKRKDGSVGFAIGDMAISNVQIADKYAKGNTVKGGGVKEPSKYEIIDSNGNEKSLNNIFDAIKLVNSKGLDLKIIDNTGHYSGGYKHINSVYVYSSINFSTLIRKFNDILKGNNIYNIHIIEVFAQGGSTKGFEYTIGGL